MNLLYFNFAFFFLSVKVLITIFYEKFFFSEIVFLGNSNLVRTKSVKLFTYKSRIRFLNNLGLDLTFKVIY